jgi:hypothetical protein
LTPVIIPSWSRIADRLSAGPAKPLCAGANRLGRESVIQVADTIGMAIANAIRPQAECGTSARNEF